MAEAVLRARLADRAPDVVVGSAGLLFDGREAEPTAVKTMRKRGIDMKEHRAQKISADLLAPASLILGMERQHVRKVVGLDGSLFARSFTLPELVHAAKVVGARDPEREDLRTWVERIGGYRNPADYAFADRTSEIDDPYGRSGRAYRECADLIESNIDALVALAWPAPHPGDTDVAPATSGGIHADRDRR